MLKTRIVVAAVLIALLVALLFFLPAVCLAAAMALVAALGAYELMRAVKAENVRMYVWPMLTAAALPLGVYFGYGVLTVKICTAFQLAVLFAETVFSYGGEKQVSFASVSAGFFAGIIIPACISSLVDMIMRQNGNLIIILAFTITAVSDSGAYFIGMAFGRHRGILKASPNKSAEGFAGSLLGGLVGVLLFGVIVNAATELTVDIGALLVYLIPCNIMTQLGDLAFSVIKRQCGIKDFGNLMPGHGGALDRFDSMIFTGPVLLMLFTAFPAF